jgi:hypothetical protein
MANLRSERPLPDDILPAQFFPTRPRTAEQRLMLAVLEDGLQIALQPPPVRRRGRALWASTNDWLCSDDEAWPFSYVNICHALALEPTRLRDRVLAQRAATANLRAAA